MREEMTLAPISMPHDPCRLITEISCVRGLCVWKTVRWLTISRSRWHRPEAAESKGDHERFHKTPVRVDRVRWFQCTRFARSRFFADVRGRASSVRRGRNAPPRLSGFCRQDRDNPSQIMSRTDHEVEVAAQAHCPLTQFRSSTAAIRHGLRISSAAIAAAHNAAACRTAVQQSCSLAGGLSRSARSRAKTDRCSRFRVSTLVIASHVPPAWLHAVRDSRCAESFPLASMPLRNMR